MPPKVKITKEDIIRAAVALVRENGEGAINARAVAAALGCSTQPVFSNFETMEDLRKAVIAAAYETYLGFLKNEAENGKYPQYKSFGMAYIRFAKEERELFRLLFMRDRNGEDLSPSPDFAQSVKMIEGAIGASVEEAELMHMELWATVHGIATMQLTSFLSLEEEHVSRMLTDMYQGLCTRYASKENHK